MTDQAVSTLRRRMIEGMSIRQFAAKTRGLGSFPWPLSRHGPATGAAAPSRYRSMNRYA
jgi:hypothetical protein